MTLLPTVAFAALIIATFLIAVPAAPVRLRIKAGRAGSQQHRSQHRSW
ncbi:hypothetical protein MRS76_18055 [Rhizobiaceae bacterium n13]|uniref:Uncharacterized protein n=1 Tax=Ferirhizobium litorale TaxID=2927786 RepID=A0AAE3U2N5_9HYPH|nr:hypothetical protein [Fererhizobium litorale]MDI7863859.1 hypothetical protein [Fererhizobium litorale]MDI7924309.1 hypothetical protein [Fererhizobium litorale]